MFSLETGLSLIFTLVSAVMSAASAVGEKEVTTRSILLPMMFRERTSPLTNDLPTSACARYSSPPWSLSSSVGEKVILVVSLVSAFLTSTRSSIETPALRLAEPSSLMMPLLASSAGPVRIFTAVFLLPMTSATSPTLRPRMFMSSGSSLAIPFPASPGLSSATLIALSFVDIMITSPFPCSTAGSRQSSWTQSSR